MLFICVKLPTSGVVCVVSGWFLDGVWMVFKGVWGCINTKSIGKTVYGVIILMYCPFFQYPLLHSNGYVCGYLDGVLLCLDGV